MELNPPTAKELKFELQMGQLIAIIIVGIILAMAAGFWLGKEAGFSKGVSMVPVEKPAYCSVDKLPDKIKVSCNELGNISLESMCRFGSQDLKEKIRIVLIGS